MAACRSWAIVAVLVLAAAVTCDRNELGDGYPDDEFTCWSCHGSEANAAPPVGLNGETEISALGVGAHQAHLAGALAGPVKCSECHAVPETTDAEGHIDALPAEVTFGPVASAGETAPEWDRESGTCNNVYCHGATLSGGSDKNPVWTQDAQLSCGSCHGFPPPPPHTLTTDCSLCHSDTVKPDGSLDIEGGKHIDGVLEVTAFHPAGWFLPTNHGPALLGGGVAGCASCHGEDLLGGTAGVSCEKCHPGFGTNCTFCHGGIDNDTGAPPSDIVGNETTDFTGVGAHTSHLLTASDKHKIFGCSECHQVPADILAPGHVDGGKAELTFGPLATAQDAQPVWDGEEATCSAVYCHGGTIGETQPLVPVWTQGPSQAVCGTCHALPPPTPHPANNDCSLCHGCVAVESDDGIVPENAALHINGKANLQKPGNCPAE